MTGMPVESVIIGGGFYGCCLALYLRREGLSVLVLEREDDLLLRASRCNQARIHAGFHYPRSLATALRSLVNLPLFVADFRRAVKTDFTMLYGVARNNSKVNATQFFNLFKRIKAPISKAGAERRDLFDRTMIEDVFAVEEYAFDCVALRDILRERLEKEKIPCQLGQKAERVAPFRGGLVVEGAKSSWPARLVVNCAYAGGNTLLSRSGLPILPFKHELTEIALIEPPRELRGLGITVMDGPFFSAMPFPGGKCWSLTHVRYTPQASWLDAEQCRDPYRALESAGLRTQFPLMVRDASRYVPSLASSVHRDSLFEVKTILSRNEMDDGRPIFLYRHEELPGLFTVLGSKVDNVYDLFDAFKAGVQGLARPGLSPGALSAGI
jgi:glycine/D-amino acid oxidase-like deaminating enzyme